MPEPVDTDPEDVARTLLNTPPNKKDEWHFMQDDGDDE